PKTLEHALGEAGQAGIGALVEANLRDQPVDLRSQRGAAQTLNLAVKCERLARREERIVERDLGKEADPPPRCQAARRVAEDARCARGRCVEAHQYLESGRLAGAVRA